MALFLVCAAICVVLAVICFFGALELFEMGGAQIVAIGTLMATGGFAVGAGVAVHTAFARKAADRSHQRMAALAAIPADLRGQMHPLLKGCDSGEIRKLADAAVLLQRRPGALVMQRCSPYRSGFSLVTAAAPFASLAEHVADTTQAICTGYRGRRYPVSVTRQVKLGAGQIMLIDCGPDGR
jgi:hypothetical protein